MWTQSVECRVLFNSLTYFLFLPIVFCIYWLLRKHLRLQNIFVLLASYVFYGWWDWRFLILIAFTSLCSYASGLLILGGKQKHGIPQSLNSDLHSIDQQSAREQAPGQPTAQSYVADTLPDTSQKHAYALNKHQKRPCGVGAKFWLWANIAINIGILAIFKYYDFFVSEFGALFGVNTESLLLRVILPVGISFYTFQALSYSIDVYRGNIKPTKDIIAFFAYISFFPQLVAGPIERATNLLPQFLQNRKFNYDQGVDGMRQILWGLFKKIVIADSCAVYVNQVWADYANQSGSTLLLAAILFTFQIYGDFAGYSDIAIGTAKLFGIKLMRNFNNPYFSRDIAEFWRRWHISLTSWFRDYVYIPLGGSRPNVVYGVRCTVESKKKLIIARNVMIVFLLCGLWHGANWTYMLWGLYHVALFLPLIIMGKNRKSREESRESRVKRISRMLLTFALVTIGWIIFRAPTVADAWGYVSTICTAGWSQTGMNYTIWMALALIGVMLGFEWHYRNTNIVPLPRNIWISYTLIALIWWFAGHHTTDFIYFQF